MNNMRNHGPRRLSAAAAVALLATLSACDFSVTNPGPVEDDFLFNEEAFPGLVVGVRRELGQALDNLDSSEQCSLGGATAVRAFAQGETPGDSCDLLTIEARYLPPASWLGSYARELSFNVFYDEGRARLVHDASGQASGFNNHANLAGYGLGLSRVRP